MKERRVVQVISGADAVDGAGVHLNRILGRSTVKDFDPFLMLDSFDSENPEDYIKGFPMHPHRGIETVTYLVEGCIEHEDSLGNKGSILSGGSQWMTSGSGIMHQEMPQASKKMLGFQLWLNLPQVEKMTEPKYFEICKEDIPTFKGDGFRVSVLSGEFEGIKGVKPHHIQAMILDARVEPGRKIRMKTPRGETAFVFLMEGEAKVADTEYHEKSALLFEDGDFVEVTTTENPLHLILFSAPPVKESVAWGGPIVMNTDEELKQAFSDLANETFIKEAPKP